MERHTLPKQERTKRHVCPHQLDDKIADKLAKLWAGAFPDAQVLPVIGYPSNADGVITITHGGGGMPHMKINGVTSKSPLANNALYSAEVVSSGNSENSYLNLYEIMLPDIPGREGKISTAELYV